MLEVGVFKVRFGMLSFFKANSLRINGSSVNVRHEVAHLIVNRRVDLL